MLPKRKRIHDERWSSKSGIKRYKGEQLALKLIKAYSAEMYKKGE